MATAAAGQLTDAELAELADLIDEMEGAYDDYDRFRAIDNEFHAVIMRASGNEVGLTIVRVIHRHGGATPPLAATPASKARSSERPPSTARSSTRSPAATASSPASGSRRHIESRWAERKTRRKVPRTSRLTAGDHSYDDHPRMHIAAVDVDLIPLPAVTPAVRVAARSPRLASRPGRRQSSASRPTTARWARPTTSGAGRCSRDIVDRILREELVGERADRREWLWHRLWELDRTEEFPIWVFGIVDVALWDLEGRVFGVPVHRLLGTYRGLDPRLRVDDDVRDRRGVPRRLRPVPRARVSGDQAARLGRCSRGR